MGDTVRFNREFYSKEAVDEAVADWAEIGTFEVAEGESYNEVKLTALTDGDFTNDDIPQVLDEFANYVLGVAVNQRR